MYNQFLQFWRVLVVLTINLLLGCSLMGQNLQIDLSSSPDFINICGGVDTMIVQVQLDGSSPTPRTNVSADITFFKGVRYGAIIPSLSSSGVNLNSQSADNQINISIPDLSTISTTVDVAFLIGADCAFLDSLNANNSALVRDEWDFTYDLGISIGLTETDFTQIYRSAFKDPELLMQVNSSIPPLRRNDCFTREIQIDNSGLGYADSLVYIARQGNGLSINQIYANGLPLTMSKMRSGTDTIVTATIYGSHFVLNTVGNGGPAGNGDGKFDQFETLILTEDLCYVDCGGSLASFHTAGWGCYSAICESIQEDDFLTDGSGEGDPDAQVLDFNLGSAVDVGYCQSGQRSVEVTNIGQEFTPTYGAMMNIRAAIALGSSIPLIDDGISVTSVTIAGVNIPSPDTDNYLDSIPLFQSDPDGVGVGLDDIDGDGYFDDLPIGESFVIDFQYDYDNTDRDSLDLDSNCNINDIATQVVTKIRWTDPCQLLESDLSNKYQIRNETESKEVVSDSDAYTNGDTFNISLNVNRRISGFVKNCSGSEQIIGRVALAPDLMPVLNECNLFYENSTVGLPVVGRTIVNDTLILVFDASGIPFGFNHTLDLNFQAGCSIPAGRLIVPTSIEHSCPPCNETHIWYCEEIEGPQMHITDPPCPPSPCIEGIKATSFSVERTTFGYADQSYTIPYDPALANRKAAIDCDSVRMEIIAEVGQTAIADSAFVRIGYSNIDESTDPLETFLFGDATLILKRGAIIIGQEPVAAADLMVTAMDDDKELMFHLDNALAAIGTTLMPGDSLFFSSNFSVNPNGPFGTDLRQVPNFRGEMLSVRDGSEYSCDNFGENFTLTKTRTILSLPNNNSWPQGSEENYINYRFVSLNNSTSVMFGNEYRQSLKVDSIAITFDPNIVSAYEVFEPELSIPNHPVHGNSFFPMPGFDQFPSGEYIIRFDTITDIPNLNDVRSYDFFFRVRAIGSSRALSGSVNGDSLYNWDPILYYRDKYFASDIGDGSCSPYVTEIPPLSQDIFYNGLPMLNMLPFTDPNLSSVGDTLEYNIQVCNTSTDYDAGVSWFSFVDSLGAFDLYTIEDVTDGSNIIDLMPTSFGTVNSWFAFSNSLDRSSVAQPIDDRCNIYRIRGRLNTCGLYNFYTNVGWNSVPFSNPAWTPDSAVISSVTSSFVTARSLDGNIEASIQQQPTTNLALCDTNDLTIIISNTDRGKIFDLNTRLILPDGLDFVPGSFEIAYPSSDAFMASVADPVYVSSELRGNVYEYTDYSNLSTDLDMNGLEGFDSFDPTSTDNDILLKFRFTTDCDYLSGSQIFYDLQGVLGCGNPSNYESIETTPIELGLPSANPNLSYALRFDPKTAFVSNSEGQLNVVINNTGTVASTTADSVEIRLPNTFSYVAASATGLTPTAFAPGEPVISLNGPIVSYAWGLPNGVIGGDSILFNFKVNSPTVACGVDSVAVVAYTKANVNATCSSSGSSCQVEVVTSDANGSIVTQLPIFNQTLLVRNEDITTSCSGASTEEVIINGFIENVGSDVNVSEITLYYMLDDDGNGIPDTMDVVVDSIKFAGPVLAGSQLAWQDTMNLASVDVCGLYLFGDTSFLGGCDPSTFFFDPPRLINAGSDIEHCQLSSSLVNYSLGDTQCASNPEFSFLWTSPISGTEGFLSNTSSPTPDLSYVYDGSLDTLIYVLETTRNGCSATYDTILIDLNVCLCDIPIITSSVVTQSRCNETIGAIHMNLLQDESLYTFSYEEVFTNTLLTETGPSLVNIAGGGYKVIIEDIAGGDFCADSVLVAVPNIDGPLATYTSTNATCQASDGTASLMPISFTYTWSDGGTGANRTDLRSGTYIVQVESPDVPGCYNYIEVEIGEDSDLTATYTVDAFATCGVADGMATITVTGGSGSYIYSWSSGTASNSTLSGGVYLVTITDNDATSCELILPVLMTNGNDAVTTITDTIDISCIGQTDGGVVYDVIYSPGFVTPVDTFISDGVTRYTNGALHSGYYCILIEDAAGCIYGGDCFQVSNPDPLGVEVLISPACDLSPSINLSPNGGNGAYTIDWADLPGSTDPEDRVDATSGNYSFTLSDANGCAITIDNLVLGVCNSNDQYFSDTVTINEVKVYCIDTLALSFGTSIDTIINDCPASANGNVDFNIDFDNFCVEYTGTSIGRDSACILVCDDMMVCDTIFMVIDVVNGMYIRDTVIRLTDTVNYSLNTSALPGNIVGVFDVCPDDHGDDVQFTVDMTNYSVEYLGTSLGTDTLCLDLRDDLGNTYLTTFEITSRDPVKEIYVDTIFRNQDETYFFDTSEIGPSIIAFTNECMTSGDTSVSFLLDNNAYIIDYSGLNVGTDTACIVACNVAGVCDTLEMRIHVDFFPDPPIAVVDSFRTFVGTPLTVNVLSNDTIFGSMDSLEVLESDEIWGDAFFNLDGSLTYNPDPKYCERWAKFDYKVCNENTCDTARVHIFIECTDIKVFNALSPNDDGYNDYLHISGIEDFPNNVLRIYNRWNVLVYEVEGYSNSDQIKWEGTWKGDKDLPDGTYYYHLVLNDEADREFKGFLEIFR